MKGKRPMSSLSVKVKLVADSNIGDGIGLPVALQERLELPDRGEVEVRVGGRKQTATLTIVSGKRVVVGSELARKLYLPLPRSLCIRYDPGAMVLHIGPVVAVFAVKRRGAGPKGRRLFGVRTADLRQLMRHGKSLGMLTYVVSPEGVDPEADYLKGYVPASKRWASGQFPIPDVVYDRIQARSWERRPSTRSAKNYLRSLPNTRYFNEGFFDKWALHQKMIEHEVLRRYVPPTEQMAGPQSLRAFLAEHPSTFIKPTEGSQGKGIVRIRRIGDRYEWRQGRRRHSTTRFESMYKNIKRIQRQNRYIMQPDLNLARFRAAPFDVRILMQRDGDGNWRQTKIYARLAAPGRLTSNLSGGGTGMILNSMLKARFGRARRRVRGRINRAITEIVHALDEVLEGPLGEVGLDLGIDRRGGVWLIEVNSKPFRKVADAGPKKGVRLSFRRPMAYARHLAQF